MLGQGTFGQVAKCSREDVPGELFAVKVIKNRPAYYHQARVEIGIVQLLNTRCDPEDRHHIVRMLDFFEHRRHLCLVFELLNINLYELIRENQFRGVSIGLQRLFLSQASLVPYWMFFAASAREFQTSSDGIYVMDFRRDQEHFIRISQVHAKHPSATTVLFHLVHCMFQ